MAKLTSLDYRFLTEKQFKVIECVHLKPGCSQSEAEKHADLTYAHVLKLIQEFRSLQIIKGVKTGRSYALYLTTKGTKLLKLYLEIQALENGGST